MKATLTLFLVGVFLSSIGFSFYYRIGLGVDASAYDRIGWNLARGFGYIENEAYRASPLHDDAIIRVGPGYEFFIAGLYSVFGHHREVVWIFHALLRVCTALFIALTVTALFGENRFAEKFGFIAALLFALNPDLLTINGMLLAETLLIAILSVCLYASVRVLRDASMHNVFIAGFFWALATLVRPTMILPTLVIGIMCAWKGRFRSMLLFFSLPILFVGGWSLRNSLLYHQPLFTTTAGSFALWVGNNPDATGGYDKPEYIQQERDAHHSVELSKISTKKYFEFVTQNPYQFIKLQMRKTAMYFSLIRPSGFWLHLKEKPVDRVISLVLSELYTVPLMIIGVAGLYLYVRRRAHYAWFLCALAIVQPLVVIPTYVETRYRYPAYLFLSLFAAYFLVERLGKRERIFAVMVSSLFFLSMTAIDLSYSWGLVLERLHFLKII